MSKGKLVTSLRPKSSMEKYPFVHQGFDMFTKEDLMSLLEENQFKVTYCLEREEPKQEIAGKKMKVEILIMSADVNK